MGDSNLHVPADSISDFLPASDRKPMKYALYNSVAIIFLVLVVILFTAIFLMLQVFLRPIGWALIVGTCLFPCKMMLTAYLREYLQHGKENDYPFSLTVALAPVHFIQSSASTLMDALRSTVFPLIVTVISTGTFLFTQEFGLFTSLGIFVFQIHSKSANFFSYISSICSLRTSIALVTAYFIVTYLKLIQMSNGQSSFIKVSMRFLFFNALASHFGFFQPVIMVGLIMMVMWGRFLPQPEPTGEPNSTKERSPSSTAGEIFRRFSLIPQSSTEESPTECSPQNPSDPFRNSNNSAAASNDSSSALVRACFTGLALLHFAVAFWTRTWLFQLVLFAFTFAALAFIVSYLQLIPAIIWVLKQALEYVKNTIRGCSIRPTASFRSAPEHADAVFSEGSDDASSNHASEDAAMSSKNEEESLLFLIFPNSLKLSLKWICRIERPFYDFVDDYLDYVVSLVIITMMVLITLLFTAFLMVQVYGETLNLISLSSSVLNSTIQSGAFSWLPDKDQLGSATRSAITNVHQFGRTVIKSKVDELFHGNLANKSDIEEQLLELWERVCMQFFHESNGTEVLVSQSSVKSSFVLTGDFGGGLNNASHNISLGLLRKRIRHLFSLGGFDYRYLVAYFHENVGEIMNVVDPLWRILSSHASFILSLFTSTVSLLLTGGSVVLDFSFSLLIFLSTLFYLLAASEQTYLPLDFVVSLTPQRGEASPVVMCFYASVEAAVASVVFTTLKRTVFYGMFTLLTHTLFGLDIVVLPSIIATILGAIPLMGTYWAVLPGVVELWCLRGSYWQALLLLLLHLLPYYFLDTALYTEIKGAGHPYLTGLSIAGGLYYFGIEGVFIGPMILCCMLVGVNLYRFLLAQSTEPLHHNVDLHLSPPVVRQRPT